MINWIIGSIIAIFTLWVFVGSILKWKKGKSGCDCSGCDVKGCVGRNQQNR